MKLFDYVFPAPPPPPDVPFFAEGQISTILFTALAQFLLNQVGPLVVREVSGVIERGAPEASRAAENALREARRTANKACGVGASIFCEAGNTLFRERQLSVAITYQRPSDAEAAAEASVKAAGEGEARVLHELDTNQDFYLGISPTAP